MRTLLLLFSFFLLGFIVLFDTHQGTLITLNMIKWLVPGELSIEGIHGNWFHPLLIDKIIYTHNNKMIEAEKITFIWNAHALPHGNRHISQLSINKLSIKNKPSAPNNLFLISQLTMNTQLTLFAPYSLYSDLKWQSMELLSNNKMLWATQPGRVFLSGSLSALILRLNSSIKHPIAADIQLITDPVSLFSLLDNKSSTSLDHSKSIKAKTIKGVLTYAHHPILFEISTKKMLATPYTIRFKTDEFPLINNEEYKIWLTSSLTYQISSSGSSTAGEIYIPKALIKPKIFSHHSAINEDIVFIHQQRKSHPISSLNQAINLHVIMGDNIKLMIKGLSGYLTGDLALYKKPISSFSAKGSLYIKNGEYNAYGQTLKIETGELLFTDAPLDNPLLNIRATKHVKTDYAGGTSYSRVEKNTKTSIQTEGFDNETTVGIHITGSLKKPRLNLFSIPSNLSEADILSLILLGKPSNQANTAGLDLLMAAVSSLNIGNENEQFLILNELKRIQKKWGIDIHLSENDHIKNNQSVKNKAVTIKKTFSDRISISYNKELAQQTNDDSITLDYLLNKFLSVEINASTNKGGIDLLYKKSDA